MKSKSMLLLLASALAVMAVGCAPKKEQKNRISTRAVRGGVTDARTSIPTNQSVSAAGKQWGEITKGSYTQANFQHHVNAFLSNLAEEDGTQVAVGSVSGDSNQGTGIRFWGSVNLSSGKLNRNGGNNAQILAQGAALRISIIDDYVGKANAAGETITEVPIYIASDVSGFKSASGNVNGNQVNIVFEDTFGKIQLQGTYTASWFYGTVMYDNNTYYNGQGPGAAGYLGVFAVPTCGFFSCQ